MPSVKLAGVSWSPVRGSRKTAAGLRRARRPGMPPPRADADVVLSGRDAAEAAVAARAARAGAGRPAWERFTSGAPSEGELVPGDVVLGLADAVRAGGGRVRAADTGMRAGWLRAGGVAADYGTGPAYDPARMR
jgi:hypothetical protein